MKQTRQHVSLKSETLGCFRAIVNAARLALVLPSLCFLFVSPSFRFLFGDSLHCAWEHGFHCEPATWQQQSLQDAKGHRMLIPIKSLSYLAEKGVRPWLDACCVQSASHPIVGTCSRRMCRWADGYGNIGPGRKCCLSISRLRRCNAPTTHHRVLEGCASPPQHSSCLWLAVNVAGLDDATSCSQH